MSRGPFSHARRADTLRDLEQELIHWAAAPAPERLDGNRAPRPAFREAMLRLGAIRGLLLEMVSSSPRKIPTLAMADGQKKFLGDIVDWVASPRWRELRQPPPDNFLRQITFLLGDSVLPVRRAAVRALVFGGDSSAADLDALGTVTIPLLISTLKEALVQPPPVDIGEVSLPTPDLLQNVDLTNLESPRIVPRNFPERTTKQPEDLWRVIYVLEGALTREGSLVVEQAEAMKLLCELGLQNDVVLDAVLRQLAQAADGGPTRKPIVREAVHRIAEASKGRTLWMWQGNASTAEIPPLADDHPLAKFRELLQREQRQRRARQSALRKQLLDILDADDQESEIVALASVALIYAGQTGPEIPARLLSLTQDGKLNHLRSVLELAIRALGHARYEPAILYLRFLATDPTFAKTSRDALFDLGEGDENSILSVLSEVSPPELVYPGETLVTWYAAIRNGLSGKTLPYLKPNDERLPLLLKTLRHTSNTPILRGAILYYLHKYAAKSPAAVEAFMEIALDVREQPPVVSALAFHCLFALKRVTQPMFERAAENGLIADLNENQLATETLRHSDADSFIRGFSEAAIENQASFIETVKASHYSANPRARALADCALANFARRFEERGTARFNFATDLVGVHVLLDILRDPVTRSHLAKAQATQVLAGAPEHSAEIRPVFRQMIDGAEPKLSTEAVYETLEERVLVSLIKLGIAEAADAIWYAERALVFNRWGLKAGYRKRRGILVTAARNFPRFQRLLGDPDVRGASRDVDLTAFLDGVLADASRPPSCTSEIFPDYGG